ncbi:MAG: aminotransferase class V-fold PLP-dependent enzyme [Planctomycetota bacterium]|nr:MAG: aminotransferase class V-fold PLP-dependent enzyme [Planctomycetota bacterium]
MRGLADAGGLDRGQCPAVDHPLYLDHAATAPPLPEALAAFDRAAREAFANPGSPHAAGARAASELARAREELVAALGADGYRVVFTATGTESDHLGIQGLARRRRRRAERAGGGAQARVLYSAVEHPAAREAARALAAEGFRVSPIPVDAGGVVRPEALRPLLGPDVALVAVMAANNELGGLNPVPELVGLVRRLAPEAAFHCDAVQWAGKRPETIASLGADAIAVAAHKVGGIRGCAALLLRRDGPEPEPLFRGGGHEGGLRSGTENVMGAAAFAAAAAVRRRLLDAEPRRYLDRRARLLELLRRERPDLVVLGPSEEAEVQGSILSLALPGCRAEPLLHRLEVRGILVGSGSACSHGGARESPVLAAIGLAPELRDSVLRISLDGGESEDDLARAAAAIAEESRR